MESPLLSTPGPEVPASPCTPPGHRSNVSGVVRQSVVEALAPLALFAALSIVMTYPLVRNFGSALPGDGRDAYQNYWNFWWTARALANGDNPFVTSMLYAPQGAPLYLHTLNIFNGLVSLPVQLIFGVAAAYNTVVILSLTLSSYFSFLLVRLLTGSRGAALVGGTVYGFSAYHFAHLLGHTNLLASEWLPAYIGLLIVASTTNGQRRAAALFGAPLTLVFLALCDWQYLLFAGLFTLVYVAYHGLARRSLAPLAASGLTWILALSALSPLLIATWRELPLIAGTRATLKGPAFFSADLLSFVTPPPLQAWWGRAAEQIGGLAIAPPVERSVYIGAVPFLLGLYGCRRRPRDTLFWALTAALFAVLALGPALQVAGQNRFGASDRVVRLPYRLLMDLPVVNVSRVPARFAVIVTLCMAVMAGFGTAALLSRVSRRPTRHRHAILILIVTLALAEQWPVPYPMTALNPPRAYQALAKLDDGRAVLELPLNLDRARSLYYQTVHQHPLFGGYLSRPLPYPWLELPPFAPGTAWTNLPDIAAPPAPGVGAWGLALANVGWIAVLREDRNLNGAEVGDTLARYALPEPRFAGERVAIYATRPPGEPLFFVWPGRGWYDREALSDGASQMRWFGEAATFDAWNLASTPRRGSFCFDAWSFERPRRLALQVDGRPAADLVIGAPGRYRVPVELAPGHHTIEFRSLDAPARPADTGASRDTRLLSIGVANVELLPDCR